MQRRRNCEETRCCRNEPRSGFSKKKKNARRLAEAISEIMAEQPPHISCLRCVPHLENSSWNPLLENLHSTKISHNESWNNCSMWQRSWSGIKKKSKAYLWSTGSKSKSKNLRILRLSIVHWQDEWKSREHMERENWLVNEFFSSGRFPRIHHIADSRRDPEHDDLNTVWTWAVPRTNHLHVNVRRHCVERTRKQNCVMRIPKPWPAMREDSRTDVGRFSNLDQKRNGTEVTRTSRMENGIVSLRTWCSTSVKVDIPYSVDPLLLNDVCEAKEK